METLQISPNILRWAPDQRGLSLDALVELLDKPAKHAQTAMSGGMMLREAASLLNVKTDKGMELSKRLGAALSCLVSGSRQTRGKPR